MLAIRRMLTRLIRIQTRSRDGMRTRKAARRSLRQNQPSPRVQSSLVQKRERGQ